MTEQFKVFYCWQSDTNENHGRYLIQEALSKAAEILAADSSVRFPVYVDQATLDEPGLCDIPNTILRKLANADAVVADLTFIAKTVPTEEDSKVKYCSNPNVLFELGYAFNAIGPERIILVANELSGEVGNQIFDLHHRRFPIAYTSPNPDSSRRATIQKLGEKLADAIRAIMPLGLRSEHSSDDEIRFERQLASIESYASQAYRGLRQEPRFEMSFRPKAFRNKRWTDAETLEKDVVAKCASRSRERYFTFPGQQTGTKRLDWGIFNNTYGVEWALTYSGLFWVSWPGSSTGEKLHLSGPELAATWPRVDQLTLSEEQWIYAPRWLEEIAMVFRFLKRFSTQFHQHEFVYWSITFRNLHDQWISFSNAGGWEYGPCAASEMIRHESASVEDFRVHCRKRFLDYLKDFCDLFSSAGRSIERDDLEEYADDID